MQIRAHASVNLWTADTVAYPFGLVHVEKDTVATVPDDVIDYKGYSLLVQAGDIVVVSPPGGGPPPEVPSGEPSETNQVQWDVKEADTDIALVTAPSTAVVVGSVFLIDLEYMTVGDISNVDNPGVTRGTYSSTVTTHTAGTPVTIWGGVVPPPTTSAASASSSKHTVVVAAKAGKK
jgi:hypothetical protein